MAGGAVSLEVEGRRNAAARIASIQSCAEQCD